MEEINKEGGKSNLNSAERRKLIINNNEDESYAAGG